MSNDAANTPGHAEAVSRREWLLSAGAGFGAVALAGLLADHVHRRHPGTEFSSYRTGHRGDVLLIGVE